MDFDSLKPQLYQDKLQTGNKLCIMINVKKKVIFFFLNELVFYLQLSYLAD